MRVIRRFGAILATAVGLAAFAPGAQAAHVAVAVIAPAPFVLAAEPYAYGWYGPRAYLPGPAFVGVGPYYRGYYRHGWAGHRHWR